MKYFCLLCLFCSSLFAQNLVLNPSFEEHENCLKREELADIFFNIPSLQLAEVKDWDCPSESGTADYFHGCFDSTMVDRKKLLSKNSFLFSVPENMDGYQAPHSGEAYAGIYVYSDLFDKEGQYREYLSGKLSQGLEKGKSYKVSFWCSLSDHSHLASSQLGIYFSQKELQYPDSFSRHIPMKAQVENGAGRYLYDKLHWMKVEGNYKAQGGEKNFLLGCFYPSEKSDLAYLYKGKQLIQIDFLRSCYYFIDDVCVSEVETACNSESDTLELAEGFEAIPFKTHENHFRVSIQDKKSKKPLEVNFELTNPQEKTFFYKTDANGKLAFTVDSADYHYLQVRAEGYLPYTQKVNKHIMNEISLNLSPEIKGSTSEILHHSDYSDGKSQHFDYAEIDLLQWVDYLRQNPHIKVRINSHGVYYTDKGKLEPQKATEERSKLLAEKMIALGANSEQVSYQGWGDTKKYGMYLNEVEILEIGVKKEKTLALDKMEVNESLVLENIYFQPNSAELSPSSFFTLDALVKALDTHPNIKISIQGHTDDGLGKSSEAYLQQLSEQRARSVLLYLVENGIAANRLTAQGFGMSKPLASNTDNAGRRKNRRTECMITEK